jgi:hypothetical protein
MGKTINLLNTNNRRNEMRRPKIWALHGTGKIMKEKNFREGDWND